MDAQDLSPFSDFYAVVLDHQYGGPLLWSPSHQAWLRAVSDTEWAAEPVEGDLVSEEQLEAARGASEEFRQQWSCPRCRGRAHPHSHFIAVDVFGDPVVYCVQQPDPQVVDSGAGTGTKKHWGSYLACPAVRDSYIRGDVPGLGRPDVVGVFAYGEPLIADEVLIRSWCSRCESAARAWRAGAADREPDEQKQRALRHHDGQLLRARRALEQWS